MKRGMHLLIDRQFGTLGPSRHADGGGLYLTVDLGGSAMGLNLDHSRQAPIKSTAHHRAIN
jgi:hypothetical protein